MSIKQLFNYYKIVIVLVVLCGLDDVEVEISNRFSSYLLTSRKPTTQLRGKSFTISCLNLVKLRS
jgi:hypothetical protein